MFIISYKRANNVLSAKWAKGATIVVPESQEAEYRKYNPKMEIMAIPDEEDGNCAKKKNAVLRRTIGEDVIIIDDDIRSIGFHEKGMIWDATEEEVLLMAENMFLMAKEAGTILWGINVEDDKKFYREYSPFSLSSVVLGPFTCIRNIDETMRFDEVIWLKEDYDFSLKVMNKYRKIIRNNKWFYEVEHITNEGGLVDKRKYDEEMRQLEMLQKKWGRNIVEIKRNTQHGNLSINPIVRIPIKGI